MWWIVLHKLDDEGQLLIHSETFKSFHACLACHQQVYPTGELWVVESIFAHGDFFQVYDSSPTGMPVFGIENSGEVVE